MQSNSGEDGILWNRSISLFYALSKAKPLRTFAGNALSLKLADIADSAPSLADASSPISVDRHRLYEDAIAMLIGTSFIALGITLYSHAMLMTGSTAGIALLIHYATGTGFGLLYFLINLPFYYFAVRRMGWAFTIRTFGSRGPIVRVHLPHAAERRF